MVRTTSNFSHGSTTIRNIISSWIIYLLSIMASHFCKSMSKEKAACTKIELTALCYHVIYLSGVDNLLRIVGQEVKEGLGIEGANWTNLFQSTLWALGVMDSNAFRAPPKKKTEPLRDHVSYLSCLGQYILPQTAPLCCLFALSVLGTSILTQVPHNAWNYYYYFG